MAAVKKKDTPTALDRYVVLTPVEHNGEKMHVGDVYELTDDVAAPLLAAQALRLEADAADDTADTVAA
jgi:hypothetical protein